MHEFCERAQAILAEARQAHADRLAKLNPLFDPPEVIARVKAANPNHACIEVPVSEWRDFLASHVPPASAGEKVKEIHRALCQGVGGAGAAQKVYVQAVDVLALHDAGAPDEPTDLDE